MRQLQKLVQKAEVVQRFERRGMDRVAAKIAQKILMFFNDDRIDARAGQKQAQHHSGGSAAHDAAPAGADLRGLVHRASPIKARLEQGFQKVAEIWDHARAPVTKLSKLPKQATFPAQPSMIWLCARTGTKLMSQNKFRDGNSILVRMEQENVKILPVIMCGGSDAGLAGVARKPSNNSFPYWLAFHLPDGGRNARRRSVRDANRPFQRRVSFLVAEQLQNINREARIVLETGSPGFRACRRGRRELAAQSGPDTIVAVLAADHVVRDREGFVALCKRRRSGGAWLYREPSASSRTRPPRAMAISRPARRSRRMAACSRSRPSSKSPMPPRRKNTSPEIYLWNSGNFFFSRRCDAEELRNFRAGDGGGGRRSCRQGQKGFELPGPRRGGLRQGAEEIDRLRSHGGTSKAASSPPTSAGRMSAIGKRSGNCPNATSRAIRSGAAASS